ncbi:hypothetical protein M405DRAFT_731452 [Rhizopogon salebrosus TDB-379]|nr:hypothetical protein M405DRAFT_731452 [Rhizopogon salebrosus TDB-379]
MTRHPFSNKYSYIHFSVEPPCTDALKLRKTMQDGLAEVFGVTASGTYLDILWIAEGGSDVIIRLAVQDTPNFLAAVVAATTPPRFSMIKETCFLPSLLSKETST